MAESSADLDATLALQEAHARAVLARRDLPEEIIEKYVRYFELTESKETGNASALERRERIDLAIQLLPHLYFKVDDVNWSPQ